MKFLIINQTFYPDNAATAQQLTDFAEDLAREGQGVTVLTGRRGYADPDLVYPSRERYQGIDIIRVWPFSFLRKNRIARIFDALCIHLAFSWQLLCLSRFDKIIAMTTPPLIACTALFFARLKKSEFIYWVMDINPEQAILAGWIDKDSMITKFLEKIFKVCLIHSDKIVVLDTFMKEHLLRKGARQEKIRVLPPWAHDDKLETIPHDANVFRRNQGWNGKFCVMYSGNHGISNPLTTLLEAALLMKDETDVIFAFIGGGERVREVLDFKEKHRLTNIVYLPYQKISDLKYSLSAADLHIVVIGERFVGVLHPCKIYGILKIGRPFAYIGPQHSHVADIIRREGVGYHVLHGDPAKLVMVIHQVRAMTDHERREISEREKKAAGAYSRHVLSRSLVDFVLQ
jgi:glycosyltransferase involved in cell wall biosynthesis